MRLALLTFVFAVAAFAAEEAEHSGASLQTSKWIHFFILAALLVWIWRKFATGAIRTRGEAIRRELEEARKLKAESEARVAQIEGRLGNLSGEIETFRAESRKMIAAEGEKIRKETEQLLARVHAQSQAEIASLTKAARAELKAEAANLALQLAEQKVAAKMTPEAHAALVSEFVHNLSSENLRVGV